VELQINDEDANPALLIAFVITTALLVATSMIAVIIATCILPHIQAVAKMALISEVNRSPHENMSVLIDISWVLANTASLFFFTLDIILLCWIKFTYFSRAAPIAATAIMGPVLLIILLFGIIFYRKIIKHQYIISNLKYQELEKLKEDIERQSEIFQLSRSHSLRSSPAGTGFTFSPGGSNRSSISSSHSWSQKSGNKNASKNASAASVYTV
jgi:hypothetical protein